MLSLCLFCRASLGTNRTLERCQQGRRFVFDQARGRLWIVCRSCQRWNLTPLEDRWDIIEDCERRFRATRIRLSTDNIGWARLPDGTDLIRVGQPLRPEFAAWRYGRELLSRRPVRLARGLAAAGLVAAPSVAGLALGPLAPLALAGAAAGWAWRLARHPALDLELAPGGPLRVSRLQIQRAELIADETSAEGWALVLDHLEERHPLRRLGLQQRFVSERAVLTGREARAAALVILPQLNEVGGSRREVAEATRWLEAAKGSDQAFATFARSRQVRPTLDHNKATIATMHPEVRLALEMAIHEDEEQRALRGELSLLEAAWLREESLAAIADRLTIPESVRQQLARLRSAIEAAS